MSASAFYLRTLDATTPTLGEVYCDPGDMILSGGYASTDLATKGRVFRDSPIINANGQGWVVRVASTDGSDVTYLIYARCLDVTA